MVVLRQPAVWSAVVRNDEMYTRCRMLYQPYNMLSSPDDPAAPHSGVVTLWQLDQHLVAAQRRQNERLVVPTTKYLWGLGV
jgi:hypothetical protein